LNSIVEFDGLALFGGDKWLGCGLGWFGLGWFGLGFWLGLGF
jgi:hypothetical protein